MDRSATRHSHLEPEASTSAPQPGWASDIPTVLLAVLFSTPDLRIYGLTTPTILFFMLLIMSYATLPKTNITKFFAFNLPYIFLFVAGVVSLAFIPYVSTHINEDTYFVANKNKDLASELLLSGYFWYRSISMRSLSHSISVFIATYTFLNISYFLSKSIGYDYSDIFHDSILDLERFSEREAFLGFEPSYTGPTTLIFLLALLSLRGSFLKLTIWGSILSFIVIISASKTVTLMLTAVFATAAFVYFRRAVGYAGAVLSSILTFATSLVIIITFVPGLFNTAVFTNRASLDPFEYGSLITRFEAMMSSIDLFLANPLGYGYGSSIIFLDNIIHSNVYDIISDEFGSAARFANTPKSQFFEYIISGGVIYFYLCIQQWRKIVQSGSTGLQGDRWSYGQISLFVATFVALIYGERLPILLSFNMLYLMRPSDTENFQTRSKRQFQSEKGISSPGASAPQSRNIPLNYE